MSQNNFGVVEVEEIVFFFSEAEDVFLYIKTEFMAFSFLSGSHVSLDVG